MAFKIEPRSSTGTPVPAPKDFETAILDADNKLWLPAASQTFDPAIGPVKTMTWVEEQTLGGADTSSLPAASALDGTELVPVVQSGTTKKTTAQDIADLGGGGSPSGIQYVDVQLSNDDVLNLRASPIDLLPSPGSGYFLSIPGYFCAVHNSAGIWNQGEVQATGTLTTSGQPTATKVMTVGNVAYLFVAHNTASNPGDIDVGTNQATAEANIVAAIMGTDGINSPNPDVEISAFASHVATLTAIEAGTAGNALPTTTDDGALAFGDATLGGGIDPGNQHLRGNDQYGNFPISGINSDVTNPESPPYYFSQWTQDAVFLAEDTPLTVRNSGSAEWQGGNAASFISFRIFYSKLPVSVFGDGSI